MISRRNIRIKVMQTLYALTTLEENKQADLTLAAGMLDEKLEQVLDLFAVSLLFTFSVAEFAETEARQRATRYLKAEADSDIETKLAHAPYVQKMLTDKTFLDRIKKHKLERYINQEWVKKVFQSLLRSEAYSTYNLNKSTLPNAEKELLYHVWQKHILGDEEILGHFVDELPGWEDDNEQIVMLMDNFFKGNSRPDFNHLLAKNKREYAHELLKTVIQKEEMCMEMIAAKLTNWDKERVALVDQLLIRMGICELLYFPTIPTKVTINEFIDIAKQYSTPQSGQFVNGVLDNILKDLVKENRIHKDEKIN